VAAGPGGDLINDYGGGDTILGGGGRDNVRVWHGGHSKGDRIFGGRGADRLVGGYAGDRIFGGMGDDLIAGLMGHDTIAGNRGHDRLFGGAYVDTFLLAGDGDTVDAGTGESDWVNYRLATASVDVDLAAGTGVVLGGGGVDRIASVVSIIGSHYSDQLRGDDGDNVIVGWSGADLMDGRGGVDWLRGTRGDDVLDGGPDKDIVEGQSGYDTCYSGNLLTCELEPPEGQ
jgi:Ca2+-binding RTX toxin-like protein